MEDALTQFEAAFRASPNAVLLVGGNGEILLTNSRLEQLFGYGEGELRGQNVEVLVPEEVRGHHPELRSAFFRLPSPRDMGVGRELYGVARDGRKIPLEIGLNPVETAAGTVVVAAIVDVTARKQQAEKVRLAVHAAATAMVMVDREGRIVLTNAQACESFGYTEPELTGRSVEVLVPERFRRRHAVYRTSFVQTPRRRPMGEGRDLFGLRKDGTEFPIEIGLTPIDAHDGHFIMSTIHDLTERKRHEAEISARNAELARLNEELTQFAYSASHDLKAPLISISGLLVCAIEDLAAGETGELGKNLERASRLATDLSQRIEAVLLLAKSDYQEEQRVDFDLRALVERLKSELQSVMRARDVVLECDFGHREPFLTEPTRMAKILENLVENAVKYADPEKAMHSVRLETRDDGDSVVLRVQDNGIGIPSDHEEEVFRMFKRFSNHRQPGSGLGLALVRKHVTRLGGRILFTSSPAGTTFEVRLPRQRSEA